MKIKLIVCINNKNVIGRNGGLLFHIKNDLQNFKRRTSDNVVIMGKNTFDTLPNSQPLPNRINIIITNDLNYSVNGHDNVFVAHSIQEAVDFCKSFKDKELFVIGGGSIYNQFLDEDLIDEAFVTKVEDNSIESGDVLINENFCNHDKWKLCFETDYQYQIIDGQNIKYKYTFLKRKQK